MSRSYKKNPGWSGRSRWSKLDKRFANKAVRNAKDVPDGKAYRRIYNPYNICDYNFRYYSRKEVVEKLTDFYGSRVYQAWIK